jgi:nitroreductase
VRADCAAPLTEDEKATVLGATMRAPTAGNMMLYSIIEIEDQVLKDRLATTCDDQPFIAKAPWVLLFVADFQRWLDVFSVSGVERLSGVEHRAVPGPGDLILACCDALIAAQNAVIAAESLGIGSCYIGDVLELTETHAELLGLPNHTMPVTLLCFGRSPVPIEPRPRYAKHVVHTNTYRRMSDAEAREMTAELQALWAPHGLKPGVENYGQAIYERKFASGFMHELNRSVAVWIECWQTAEAPVR